LEIINHREAVRGTVRNASVLSETNKQSTRVQRNQIRPPRVERDRAWRRGGQWKAADGKENETRHQEGWNDRQKEVEERERRGRGNNERDGEWEREHTGGLDLIAVCLSLEWLMQDFWQPARYFWRILGEGAWGEGGSGGRRRIQSRTCACGPFQA
jgi:hypothetical protein